ncbi:unnamed protein product [Hydatigera taeniaeformis]|uniref:PHD-type domain-containing protein n=1 Tax=Hydatigena taeniaeformis TaxID=6205 RepID=A0A0R3WYX1_HYDTA|nr:unnamed protein product [Hydatigera taeniaeformis]
MPLANCGRTGCRFPIKLDKIVCCACSTAFHPQCSDLCPEDFVDKSGSGNWYCPTCAVEITAEGDRVTGVVNAQSTDIGSLPHSFPIAYVTSNPNKLRETIEILGEEYAGMLKQVDVDLPEYQGSSPEEIVRLKCYHAAKIVGGPVLVEDTCLAFDALNGLPGPYIKWFLRAVGPEGKYHKFKCSVFDPYSPFHCALT